MKLMKYVPNTLSFTRLFLSASLLLFIPVANPYTPTGFSPVFLIPAVDPIYPTVILPMFLVFYTIAGITDMLDGAIARKFGVATPFGANLDAIADYALVCAALVRLVPVIIGAGLNALLVVVIVSGLVILKCVNMIVGWVRYRQIMMIHSYGSKFTALMAFLFPLIFSISNFDVNVLVFFIGLCVYFYLLEEIAIYVVMPEPRRDITGIRQALRIRREAKLQNE